MDWQFKEFPSTPHPIFYGCGEREREKLRLNIIYISLKKGWVRSPLGEREREITPIMIGYFELPDLF